MRIKYVPGTNVPIQKQKKKVRWVMWTVSIIFAIYSLSLVLPVVWGLMASIMDRTQFLTDKVSFPNPPKFVNYITAFTELQTEGNNMFMMIFNSLWYSVGNPLIAVFTTMISSYVCAKYSKNTLCRIVYWIAIMTMMIPISGSLPSSLKISQMLGLYDNPLTLVTSIGGLGSNFVIGYAFFKGVDWAYAESAFMDGASHFRVFFQIMLPQAISPIIALVLTGFISAWNDSKGTLVYLPSYPTLASGFYTYQMLQGRSLNWPVYFAGLFVAATPIIVLYISFQDTLMNINMSGGIKG